MVKQVADDQATKADSASGKPKINSKAIRRKKVSGSFDDRLEQVEAGTGEKGATRAGSRAAEGRSQVKY